VILFPYEQPDPARDRQDLITYAEAGHAPSQRALADCYRIGDEFNLVALGQLLRRRLQW
jgi:hypothetical protein